MRIYKVFTAPSGGNLYQSGFPSDVDFMDENGKVKIDYLLCLSQRSPWYGNFRTFIWKIDDGPLPEPEHIRTAAKTVELWLGYKQNVLVHCDQGLNRSGLITARTMMYFGITYEDALTMLRERRDVNVLFNTNFDGWLRTEEVSPKVDT